MLRGTEPIQVPIMATKWLVSKVGWWPVIAGWVLSTLGILLYQFAS